jgi:MEDS: MEthanogen/methylotroph, DcmR Sensory domain
MSPPVVGSDVRHSSHVCLPFESDEEKHEGTVTFIHEGLSRGARCIFSGTKEDFDTLGRGLEQSGICTRRAAARGALLFRTVEEMYLYGGIFDPPRVLDHTDQLIDAALVDGFTGLRLTAELTRIPAQAEWQKIVWYEAMTNERFARRPVAGLCRYPRCMIPAERVRDILRTHPTAIVRGETCENPFYERPEIVLSDDSETRIDWQFRQLRVHQRTLQHLEGTRSSAVAAAAELAAELHHLRSGLKKPTKPD